MKRTLWSILLLLTAFSGLSSAQPRGSYFFESALLRNRFNPAFAPKSDYASLPIVGNFRLETASNVGLKNFIFPQGETNYLFLNDHVPADVFLGELPRKDPYLHERLETDLFGYGMRIGRGGYATLGLSLVEEGGFVLSGDLLRFAKAGSAGVAQETFPGGTAQFAGYAALTGGYSRDLGELLAGLRAGVRIKLLLGLAAADFSVDQIGLQFGQDQIAASTHGNGVLSGIGYDGGGLSFPGFKPGNLGAAVDLGVAWTLPLDGPAPLSSLELSASLGNLGFIRYRHHLSALTLDGRFSFAGIPDFSGDLRAQFEQIAHDFKELAHIESSEGQPFRYVLQPDIYIGATARLLQDKANAGLLYYHTLGHGNLMIAFGGSPFAWLNLGANYTFLGPAGRLGIQAEFIPKKYVGFFCGVERASWRRNTSHIPIRNFTDSFSFGINVLFGN